MATTPNYDINYEDDRLSAVKTAETDQLAEDAQLGQQMLTNVETMYDDAKAATDLWEQTQIDKQNEQTNLTIQQIERQKEQAQKDYTKEQAGAYVDWQKQSNQYGVNAEKMASAGLTNTGYSESSQVSMYNTYQNRVAVAREAFSQIWTDYNNKINEAKIQNNAVLAEIATQAAQQRAEYVIQSVLQKNQLLSDIADRKMQTKQFYATQWQNVLDQMNKENTLAEEVRQFNEKLDFDAKQADLDRQWKEKEAQLERDFQAKRDKLQQDFEAAQAVLDRKHDLDLVDAKTKAEKELADHNHELAMKQLEQEQKNKLAQLDKQLANEKALALYESELANQNKSGTIGGNSGSGGGISASDAAKYGTSLPLLKNSTTTKTQTSASTSTGKTTQKTLDSITALGYGPITAAKLDKLVASGEVIEYVSNGVTLFRRANAQTKTSKLYQQLQKPASVSLPTSKLRK